MGGASRVKQSGTRRQQIAAQRAAAERARMRNRILLALGSAAAVIAIVAVLVVVKPGSGPGIAAAASDSPAGPALHSLVPDVTSVPASVLDSVGEGDVTGGLTRVSGPPLTSDGKPELLYVGANFCPFCAAER